MMSKADTEFHKFSGFMRLSHVPPHYDHLMISQVMTTSPLLYEGLYVGWWDQSHVVPQLLKFPAPAMRRRTRLHGDHAFRLLCHEREKLTS